MTGRARSLIWVLLAVVAVGVLGVVALGRDDETDAERAQRLAKSFACPECAGESVAASSSSTSRRIRQIIQDGIEEDASDAEITATILATYPGRDLRLDPPSDGIGAIVWVVPMLGVLAGAVAIFFAVRRWSDTPRLAATSADEELVARLRRGSGRDDE